MAEDETIIKSKIEELRKEYNLIKASLSKLRKEGKDVRLIEYKAANIPSKLEYISITLSMSDITKVVILLQEIKMEITNIEK